MKFGVFLNTQAVSGGPELPEIYDQLLETAELADELGFDYVFLPEHHQQPDGYLPSPFTMAAAIAARTTRVGIATGIHLLPLWDPMRVAEDVAVVDNLSRGRFTLGVGLGLVKHEFEQFRIDIKTAASRMEEQIAILREAWSDAPVTFQGQHFSFGSVPVTPKPVQRPGPRILIGGMSEAAVKRAGRIADGWLTDPLHTAKALQGWAATYRETADAHNRASSIWLQRDCWVADEESVLEHWAPHLVDDWRFYFGLGLFSSGRFNPEAEPWIAEINDPSELNFGQLRDDRVVVGTPETVTATLSSMAQTLDPEVVCFRFRFPGGPDHARTLQSIRRFGEEVIPRLSSSSGSS